MLGYQYEETTATARPPLGRVGVCNGQLLCPRPSRNLDTRRTLTDALTLKGTGA